MDGDPQHLDARNRRVAPGRQIQFVQSRAFGRIIPPGSQVYITVLSHGQFARIGRHRHLPLHRKTRDVDQRHGVTLLPRLGYRQHLFVHRRNPLVPPRRSVAGDVVHFERRGVDPGHLAAVKRYECFPASTSHGARFAIRAVGLTHVEAFQQPTRNGIDDQYLVALIHCHIELRTVDLHVVGRIAHRLAGVGFRKAVRGALGRQVVVVEGRIFVAERAFAQDPVASCFGHRNDDSAAVLFASGQQQSRRCGQQ